MNMKEKKFFTRKFLRWAALLPALALALLLTGPASAERYAPGDVLVVFKGEEGHRVTAASLDLGREAFRVASIATASGAWVKDTYAGLSEASGGVFALLHSDVLSTDQLVEDFLSRPDVIAASPNYLVRVAELPNDPISPSNGLWGLDAIDAPAMWDRTTGGGEVRVAVIDTGIDASHPDLAANIDTARSRNFSSSDPSAWADDNGHGTHVTGTIGAVGNNGVGTVGVNWNVGIIALKSIRANGSGYVSDIIKALNYLTELLNEDPNFNLAAVNLSLATYSSMSPTAENQAREPLWRALKALDRMNRTVIVVAAGNEGLEVGAPAPYSDTSGEGIFSRGEYVYPASFKGLNNMLSVAALSEDLTVPSFSNWNASIAAPGVDIISTFPQTLSERQDAKYGATTLPDGSRVGIARGTSMASPHVAGAAALLRAAVPGLTAYQVRTALLGGASSGAVSLAGGEGGLSLTGALRYQEENALPSQHDRDAYDVAYDSYSDSSSSIFDGLLSGGSGCAALGASPLLLLALLPLFARRRGARRGTWRAALCLSMAALLCASGPAASSDGVLVIFRDEPGARVTAASLNGGMDAFRVASLAAEAGARVSARYGALSEAGGGAMVLLRSDEKSDAELLQELRARPDVLSACRNCELRLADVTPDDPLFDQLWGMSIINAPAAWETTTGGSSVYVAVIDTGIAASHPDLRANIDTTRSRNFYPGSSTSDYEDDQGHGSHVAGIIGAVGNNGVGVAGVNWQVRLIVLKIFQGRTTDLNYLIEALNYLTQLLANEPGLNLAAVNMSFTTYMLSSTPSQMSNPSSDGYILWQAMSALDRTNRALLVVAAGNEGMEVGVPAPSSSRGAVQGNYIYPASMEGLNNMVAVAAIGSDGTIASTSNYSASKVPLAAPGVDILSTVPYSLYSAGYHSISGTSQASPHVAGAAALLRAVYPGATTAQLKAALTGGATATDALRGYTASGLLNVRGALDALAGNGSSSDDSGSSGGDDTGGDTGGTENGGNSSETGNNSGSTTKGSKGGGGCAGFASTLCLLLLPALWLRRRG